MRYKCVRCCKEAAYTIRGLCKPCFNEINQTPEMEDYPSKRQRIESKSINDPHIRWLFSEMEAQKRTIIELEHTSGITKTVISKWKTKENPSFFDFKCVIEALGYEIRIVAMEPKDESNENADYAEEKI